MPGISDIKAGGAYVEIGTRDSDLVAGLNRAATKLRQFGSAIRGIGLQIGAAGGAIFAPLVAAGKLFADQGSQLLASSRMTGVAVEALSSLGYAAKQSHVEVESLDGALNKMGRTLTEAAGGSDKALGALRQVGLTVADLSHLSPDERMKAIADGLNKITDPSVRAAAAMGIFGKSGASLLPLLSQGSAGIDAMQARAKALGLEWTSDDAKAAKDFGNAIEDVEAAATRLATRIGSAVAPVLKVAAEYLASAAAAAGRWVDAHRDVFQTAVVVSGVLLATGAAIAAAGTAFTIAGIGLGTFASLIGIVVTAVGAIFSPIGLAIAAVVGLGYAFFSLTSYGRQVAQYLSGVWKAVSGDAITSFGAIKAALSAKDWALAAQILWAMIQLEWAKGIGALEAAWSAIKTPILTTWNDIVYGLLEAWSMVTSRIKAMIADLVAFAKVSFNEVTGFVAKIVLANDSTLTPQQQIDAFKSQDQQTAQSNAQARDESSVTKSKIGDERNATLESLAAANKSENDAIAAGNRAEAGRLKDKVDALQKQFNDLAAKAKVEAATSATRLGPSPAPPDDQNRPNLSEAAKSAGAKIPGVFQTLSAQLVGEIFGQRGDDSAKQTAANTREMLKLMRSRQSRGLPLLKTV